MEVSFLKPELSFIKTITELCNRTALLGCWNWNVCVCAVHDYNLWAYISIQHIVGTQMLNE